MARVSLRPKPPEPPRRPAPRHAAIAAEVAALERQVSEARGWCTPADYRLAELREELATLTGE